MNIGEQSISFSLYDQTSKLGAKGLSVPAHAIQTYTWRASGKISVEAQALVSAAAATGEAGQGGGEEVEAKGAAGPSEPTPLAGAGGGKAGKLPRNGLWLAGDAGLDAEVGEEAEATLAANVAAAQRMQAETSAAPLPPLSNTNETVLAVAALIVVATAAGLLVRTATRRQWRQLGTRQALLEEEPAQTSEYYDPFISPGGARHDTRRGARALA
jgi:hypothetical protein